MEQDKNSKDGFGESLPETGETERAIAGSLASRILRQFLRFDDDVFSEDHVCAKLGVEFQVLIEDTVGLLEGIAAGRIRYSQPRIASNLGKACKGIECLGDEFSNDCGVLAGFLKEASAAGLTADNNGVELPRRDQRRAR